MNLEARKEFCEYVYNRIKTKLTEAGEYELLAFAITSVETALRQSDALGLKWDQINIEDKIIKDLMIRKNNFVIDIPLTDNAIDALKAWYDKTDNKDKVFPNLKVYKCADRIGELIGDNLFSGHELRNIGLSLKACEI